jgi:hypothetical protein
MNDFRLKGILALAATRWWTNKNRKTERINAKKGGTKRGRDNGNRAR